MGDLNSVQQILYTIIIFGTVLNAGQETTMFTVEVVYNGFFCGLRENLEYVSCTTAHLIIVLLIHGPFCGLMKY